MDIRAAILMAYSGIKQKPPLLSGRQIILYAVNPMA
jgi:hypothetical protein